MREDRESGRGIRGKRRIRLSAGVDDAFTSN